MSFKPNYKVIKHALLLKLILKLLALRTHNLLHIITEEGLGLFKADHNREDI